MFFFQHPAFARLAAVVLIASFVMTGVAIAQDDDPSKSDPTKPSKLIEETKQKIRNVEQYDKLKAEFDNLSKAKESLEISLNGIIDKLKSEKSAMQSRMESELEKLRETNADAKKEQTRMAGEMKQLRSENATAKKEQSKLETELEKLRMENKTAKEGFDNQLAELRATLDALKNEAAKQKAIVLPEILVRSRVISDSQSMVTLSIGGATSYFREGDISKVSIEGEKATAMIVKSITSNVVEIDFPEINRSIALY